VLLTRAGADALLAFVPSEACQPCHTGRNPPLMWLPRAPARRRSPSANRPEPKSQRISFWPTSGCRCGRAWELLREQPSPLEVYHLPASRYPERSAVRPFCSPTRA
jgi:hypothetical protein